MTVILIFQVFICRVPKREVCSARKEYRIGFRACKALLARSESDIYQGTTSAILYCLQLAHQCLWYVQQILGPLPSSFQLLMTSRMLLRAKMLWGERGGGADED